MKFSELQSKGLNPFILIHGKKEPACKWAQYQTQRVTSEQCAEWDAGRYNIGIATGKISGCFVVDVDGAEGEATLSALVAKYGELPTTVEAKTGRGRHLYFRYPEGAEIRNKASHAADGNVLRGLDVRGDGGYVVAPPSLHPDGSSYEWTNSPDDMPIADAPDWLVTLFATPIKREAPLLELCGKSDAYLDKALRGILSDLSQAPDGGRNDALNKAAFAAGQLIFGGLDEREAINRLQAQAQAIGLGSPEIMATIESGVAAGKANPRTIGIAPQCHEAIVSKTIFLPALEGLPIPPREWAIQHWALMRSVAALYGDGGTGKSLLAMQMMTCVALGIPFMGLQVKQVPVIGFFCEDTEDELHRRQTDINRHYGIEFSQLSNMYWQSRVGCDNVLMAFIRDGEGTATDAYHYLRQEVLRVGARFVVFDTAADTFGGNENIRPQVRRFINLLGKLALEIDGTVLLCAHPSASGLQRNDGTGGSTAWNNTVRSRLYLSRPTDKEGEGYTIREARDIRKLSKMKANYSTIDDTLTIKWNEGAFALVEGTGSDFVSQLEQKNQEKADDEIFLSLLDQLTSQGRTLSDSKQAANFAPKAMIRIPAASGISHKRLAAAMDRLFSNGIIDRGYVMTGADRKKREGIRRKPEKVCSEVQRGCQ